MDGTVYSWPGYSCVMDRPTGPLLTRSQLLYGPYGQWLIRLQFLYGPYGPLLTCTIASCCIWSHCPWKSGHGALEPRPIQSIFIIWLPRPNHYAGEMCTEILCRTPVSKSKWVSSGIHPCAQLQIYFPGQNLDLNIPFRNPAVLFMIREMATK